jgi:alanine dehydrogenase
MLILSRSDISGVLTMRDCIDAVEEGFRAMGRGDVLAPERLALSLPDGKGVALQMPAHMTLPARGQARAEGALGAKIVTVFESNIDRNLEAIQSIYLLFASDTGVPLALMDGRFITALRTAATSALATKFMATSEPKRAAIFGAGPQAQFHIKAMFEVCDVQKIFITSRTMEKATALAQEAASEFAITCEVVSPETAARESNLICACSSSPAPLFDGSLIKPGAHINAVGAFTPETRELDTLTIQRARVIIDAASAAGREAGEILIPLSEGAILPDHIKGTLADVVAGKVAGRVSDEEITLFKSCGHAIEDLVTAKLAYEKAIALGIGTEIAL